jgi:hypothetical protein
VYHVIFVIKSGAVADAAPAMTAQGSLFIAQALRS